MMAVHTTIITTSKNKIQRYWRGGGRDRDKQPWGVPLIFRVLDSLYGSNEVHPGMLLEILRHRAKADISGSRQSFNFWSSWAQETSLGGKQGYQGWYPCIYILQDKLGWLKSNQWNQWNLKLKVLGSKMVYPTHPLCFIVPSGAPHFSVSMTTVRDLLIILQGLLKVVHYAKRWFNEHPKFHWCLFPPLLLVK